MKARNILHSIGKTPLIELKKFSPTSKIKIYAKLEGTNPGGSIKDRVAKYLILEAEKKRMLNKSKTIIEATSGNTGIGLAMVAALKGYNFLAVMPENASIERIKILKQFGAQLILTEGSKGTNYSLKVAKNIVKKDPTKFIMLNQYENPANIKAHYETTALEIIKQIPEITHFVAGVGTGGTITGTGKRLKKYNPKIQIIGVEPTENSKIQGLRNMTNYTPPIFNKKLLDATLKIKEDHKAFSLAKKLPIKEGISVGISSGAALWGALQIAQKIKQGAIVTIFPDQADRYVSTDLFN